MLFLILIIQIIDTILIYLCFSEISKTLDNSFEIGKEFRRLNKNLRRKR